MYNKLLIISNYINNIYYIGIMSLICFSVLFNPIYANVPSKPIGGNIPTKLLLDRDRGKFETKTPKYDHVGDGVKRIQCVSWVKARREDLPSKNIKWVNANHTLSLFSEKSKNPKLRRKINHSPRVGAAFVLPKRPGRPLGHMGIVENVILSDFKDGKFTYILTVSDYNRNDNGKYKINEFELTIDINGNIHSWNGNEKDKLVYFIHQTPEEFSTISRKINIINQKLFNNGLIDSSRENSSNWNEIMRQIIYKDEMLLDGIRKLMNIYKERLNREIDISGFARYAGLLLNGALIGEIENEILNSEEYNQLTDGRDEIHNHIDEKPSAQHIVKEKIARVSQEQISKEAQLRKIQTKVSEFRSNRKSKQSKLNKLIRRQQVMPSVIKRYEIELKTLKFRVKILQAVSKIKKSFSRKRKTIKSLPKKVKDALKKAADRLGTNWQKMYILAERLYDKANQEATDLKIRIVKTSNLSTREALLVTRLKREIKSLESQINVATSNAGRIQRELAKLTNEQQTYNKELTTLQQAATSVEAPITKHSYNYNKYSPSSLVSLGKTITHPEQPENEVIQTTQLDQQENQRQAEEQAIREFNDSQRVEIAEAAPNQPEQPTTPPTTPAPETPAGKYRGVYSAISPTLHTYYYIEQADSAEFGKGSANQNVALNPEIVAKNINTGSGDHFGDYQYTALGQWNSDNHVLIKPDESNSHNLNGGYWVIGQDATDIPAQGSANYSGELNGDYMNSSGSVSRGIMGGTIGLNVAFSNKTISGNLFVTKSGDFYSAAEFSNATIGQPVDGASAGIDVSNVFQADMTITSGVGRGGEIGGLIYGQGATEIGGGWQIDESAGDSGTGASGVFRAKQSQPTSPNLNPSLEWGGWGSVVGSDTTSSGPDSYQYASTGTESPHNALPKGGSSAQINLDGVNQSVTATPDYGDYDYVAWGTWDGGSSTTFERYDGAIFNDVKGHWAYGQALGADDIPRYGSANYAGQVMGGYVSHHDGIVEANSISGDINMIVGFRDGNNSLSGTMNLDRNGSDWATATFNTQNARANPTDPDFKTPLNVVNGGNGELNGAFFGANAAEVGGSFYIDKQHGDGGGAAGVYRAKKQ